MKCKNISFIIMTLAVIGGCAQGTRTSDVFPFMDFKHDARADPLVIARVEQLSKNNAPAILILVENREALGTMFQVQNTGNTTAWLSGDNSMITLNQGLLMASRGLGWDLMSSDVTASARHIHSGKTGSVTRVSRHLDGDDQMITDVFSCEIESRGAREIEISNVVYNTRLMQERCESGDTSFESLYWVGIHGEGIMQSRQWASVEIGIVSILHLQ